MTKTKKKYPKVTPLTNEEIYEKWYEKVTDVATAIGRRNYFKQEEIEDCVSSVMCSMFALTEDQRSTANDSYYRCVIYSKTRNYIRDFKNKWGRVCLWDPSDITSMVDQGLYHNRDFNQEKMNDE